MNADKNFRQLHMETLELFKNQDVENGDFDVVFELNGKEIYANKFMLSSASPTFKSMLSGRWTKPDEPVIIKDYSFEEFKEFLTFLYAGECSLTPDNIFAMVDMAEFYGVNVFKKACEIYLKNYFLNLTNVFQLLEVANKYCLSSLKVSIIHFISKNLSIILKSQQFHGLEKSVVKFIVQSSHEVPRHEELFEEVYKWAESRATEKLKKNLNLNESIKEDLSDILPFIKLRKMEKEFLVQFDVKITDKNGKKMTGELQCYETENVIAVIQSQKDICSRSGSYCWWYTRQIKPSSPSKLFKDNKISWYLVYECYGDLAVKHRCQLNNASDYLLAEMFPEHGFQLSVGCKINLCLFA
uniref:BTB domain-containing protein n=1 Tax=Panagrolaimus sp. ES5 TaxID=591445 RepID=A0AC34FQK7_9BILA